MLQLDTPPPTRADILLIALCIVLALAAGTLIGRARSAMREEIAAVQRGEIVGADPQEGFDYSSTHSGSGCPRASWPEDGE